jgi:hypothetical protein
MNLHNIAAQAVSAVNPLTPMIILKSTGYTTRADGSQDPTYTPVTAAGNVQTLTGKDIAQLNSLGIQGVTQKVYLNGDFEGVFRVLGKGGDLLKFGGQTWLVSAVMERWPDWVCVAITMQLDGPW